MKLKKVLESDFIINLSHIDLDGFGSGYVIEQYVQKSCNLVSCRLGADDRI